MVPDALERVAAALPEGFPVKRVFEPIHKDMIAQAEKFITET